MHKAARFLVMLAAICLIGFPARAADVLSTANDQVPCFSLNGCTQKDLTQTASLPAAAAAGPQIPVPKFIPRSTVAYPPPMTPKEKFHYYLRHTYGPKSFASSLAGAGINQARDTVEEWGQGMEGYGKRFGSSFGQSAVKGTIYMGLAIAFHEDPRFYYSGRTGIWERTLYAAGQIFVAHTDSGGRRLNYPLYISAFGGAYISRQWHPDRYHDWGDYMSAFGTSMGITAAKNVFYEFWPDIKRRLHVP